LAQWALTGSGFCCGLNWSLPVNHFENVNPQGKFSYWQKLGEIKVGEDFALPIHLNFRGDRYMESAGLGVPCFMVGLTDSNIVALDARHFLVQTPAGRYRMFRRDPKNPNILRGSSKWAGEIQGETITVASECGDKLVFQQGRLARMQVKERTFEFIRNGNRVTEVREGGHPLASLRENRLTGAVELVQRGGEVISFEMGKRPLVQALAGSPTPVIGELVGAVTKITLPGGQETRFEFGTNEKLLPTVGISNGEPDQTTRTIAWNPGTGEMIKDGEWMYEIKSGDGARDNAAIGRTNGDGAKEFWHRNKGNGFEIIRTVDGITQTVFLFTSGILRGKTRALTTSRNNKEILRINISRDQDGNITRHIVKSKL